MKNLLYNFLLFAIIALISSCSSTKEIGTETIVDKSGPTPYWINQGSSDSKKDTIFFTGQITKAIDRSFGMHQAYADGMIQVLRSMEKDVNGLTGTAATGSNVEEGDIGRYTSFGMSEKYKSLTVSGIFNPDTYWEKVEIKNNSRINYTYNCYSLLKISKTDYDKNIKGTLEAARKKAQEENNKKAEELLNGLINDLNNKQQ